MLKASLVSLLAGNLLMLSASMAQGATVTHTINIAPKNTNWDPTELLIPQYNPAEHGGEALRSIFIEAIGGMKGDYSVKNTGTRNQVIYGTRYSDIGAELQVVGPSSSIVLHPTPIDTVGHGTLIPSSIFTTNVDGIDTHAEYVADSFFSLYTGNDMVMFVADAMSIIDVSKSGTPFQEDADIMASLALKVTYEFDDPASPVELPETAPGILSFVAMGLGMISFKRVKR